MYSSLDEFAPLSSAPDSGASQMVRWLMKLSGAAPCQCHSPGGVYGVAGSEGDDFTAARLGASQALGDPKGLSQSV